MRSKRLTRSIKTQDVTEKTKHSGADSTANQRPERSNRVGETRNFLSTSTPAKQTRSHDTGLSDDTDEEISFVLRDTPTGLRMKSFFRDEFLSSQNADSQLDVRWDHTSPNAYRHLQRVPKKSVKQAREDLSDIVCRLAPAVNGDGTELESVSSTPPLLCSWLQANKATSNNIPFEGQIFRHGQRTKRGLKKKKTNVKKFDDVLNNLHMCLERLDHDDEDNDRPDNQRSTRSSLEDEFALAGERDHNKNFVRSNRSYSNASPSHKATVTSTLLPNDAALALLEEEEDLWSDEELFKDNSFILQATQLTTEKVALFSPSLCGGKRKQISPVLDQPKNKTKRCAVSPKWENELENHDLIPPTCTSKSNFSISRKAAVSNNSVHNGGMNGNLKTNFNNNLNYGRQNPASLVTVTSKCESKSTARSPLRKHSSFSGYEKKSACASSTVGRNNKSPWRKTSSFSGRVSATSNTQCQAQSKACKPVPKPVQNSLFRNQRETNVTRTSTKIIAKRESDNQAPATKSPKLPTVGKELSPSYKRTNLDTSLSDEILRQLAEPDEILESQINVVQPENEVKNKVVDEFEDFFNSDDDFSINETMMLAASQTSSKPKCSDNSTIKSEITTHKPCTSSYKVLNSNLQHESNQNGIAKLTIHSDVVNVQESKTQKKIFQQRTGVANQSKSDNVIKACQRNSSQSRFTFRSTSRQCPSGASASTFSKPQNTKRSPKQQHQPHQRSSRVTDSKFSGLKTKTKTDEEELSDTQILMSSQALMEDDSFMKDDALFESQILAMLDEVEFEATQQTKEETFLETDKISCSPEEIEKKRLAALAKRKSKAKR